MSRGGLLQPRCCTQRVLQALCEGRTVRAAHYCTGDHDQSGHGQNQAVRRCVDEGSRVRRSTEALALARAVPSFQKLNCYTHFYAQDSGRSCNSLPRPRPCASRRAHEVAQLPLVALLYHGLGGVPRGVSSLHAPLHLRRNQRRLCSSHRARPAAASRVVVVDDMLRRIVAVRKRRRRRLHLLVQGSGMRLWAELVPARRRLQGRRLKMRFLGRRVAAAEGFGVRRDGTVGGSMKIHLARLWRPTSRWRRPLPALTPPSRQRPVSARAKLSRSTHATPQAWKHALV